MNHHFPRASYVEEIDETFAARFLESLDRGGDAAMLRAERLLAHSTARDWLWRLDSRQPSDHLDSKSASDASELLGKATVKLGQMLLARWPLNGAPEQRAIQRRTWLAIADLSGTARMTTEKRYAVSQRLFAATRARETLQDKRSRSAVLEWALALQKARSADVASMADQLLSFVAPARNTSSGCAEFRRVFRDWQGDVLAVACGGAAK